MKKHHPSHISFSLCPYVYECSPFVSCYLFGAVFQYSGLVTPVNKVWTEKVTGHQVMLVWKHRHDRQKAHFLPPDSYQVTWWPGETAEGSTHSYYLLRCCSLADVAVVYIWYECNKEISFQIHYSSLHIYHGQNLCHPYPYLKIRSLTVDFI